MPPLARSSLFVLMAVLSGASLAAPNPPGANSDPTYQQLRTIGFSGESIAVESVDLKRDAATFHLRSGTVCFVPPVLGKVTGAVFVGDGSMSFNPAQASERRSLKLLTKSDEFKESFQHLVLRFTDSTYDELKKAGGRTTQGACDAGLLKDSQYTTRHKLHYNLDARIFQDVLRPDPGGLFVAFVHGKKYDDKLLYVIDPNGAPEAFDEEVGLMTYDENKEGIWAAFRISNDYRLKLAEAAKASRVHIDSQYLDTTIEGNARLAGKARTTFAPLTDGSRAVPFDLFPSLRVQSVLGPDGQPLSFVQEDKNDDPDFYVVFPKPLSREERYAITTTYEGKDAVVGTGGGNYYVSGGARDSWYPGNASSGLADYTNFDMIFRIPKGMKMAAAGSLVSEREEGGKSVTVWKSDVAQPLAGFQFGRMKVEEVKLTSPEFLVAAYANENPPDGYVHFQGGTMGNLSTVSMMKGPLSEAQFAIKLYTSYFGPLPFKRLSVTQQTACNYGQSWPDLVWLPICSFYDTTVRHQLGLDWADNGYWDVVTPHEVSHQWWGQLVGFDSYRDQWMSEGFADFSASLFLQSAYGPKGTKMYAKFWSDERKSIIQRNQFGFRAIDVGPVTMGYRLNNSKAGFNIARDLIYPKGAYILQMVRMMMWNGQTGDQNFKETMQDFVRANSGRSASTEDFKAILEKHMTRDMNVGGNGKMDWFFDEYVYGTSLPSYAFSPKFDRNPAGEVVFNYKLTQSGVDDNFIMPVPVYFELADGRTIQIGRIRVKGNSTSDGKVTLKDMKDPPKRALINHNFDVLAAN